jgi:integrase
MQDMAKYPHLKRSGKRGMLSYRRGVPDHLRPILGKREIIMAFGTAEFSPPQYHFIAAEAERELELAQAEFDWRQEEADALAEGGGTIINDFIPELLAGEHHNIFEARCRRHYLECMELERAFRTETTKRVSQDPEAFWRGEIIELPMTRKQFYSLPEFAPMKRAAEGYKLLLAMAYRKRLEVRLMGLKAMLVTQDFKALGSTFSCCVDCAQKMGLAIAQTEIRLINDLLADDAALLPSVVDVAQALAQQARHGSSPQVAPSAAQGPKLSQAVNEWVIAGSRGASAWSFERAALCKRVLKDFIQVCGDKPIGAYNKGDGRSFVALLRQLPANIDKLQAGLDVHTRDLVKICEIAKSRGLAPQDDATTNKKIGIVQQCFRWIMARFDECSASPVDGMKLTLRKSVRDKKDPFTTDQLNAIFAAPVFTGCKSELNWSKHGSLVLRSSPKFWVPLIALFTGMRSGEICQLTQEHVRVHDGVHYFALSKELRLKNDASIRSVPIHRVLIECGLLDFVAQCDGRLFPHLRAHISGRLSDAFGKHFSRFLRSLSIKTENTDFHSFRHNFIAAAEASGVEYATRERLVGHVLQGQAGRYGKRYDQEQQDMQLLSARNAELQKLCFPGLQLSHLAPDLPGAAITGL